MTRPGSAPMLRLSQVTRVYRRGAVEVCAPPRRTAATASALTIGFALVSGLSVMAESAKASMAELIDQQLTADFVLSSELSTTVPTRFPAPVAEAVAALPGVRSVAPLGFLELRVGQDSLFGSPGTGSGIADNVKIHLTSGSVTALDAGQLLVNESTAERFGWKVGSALTATVGALEGERLTIGGIYQDNPTLNPVLTDELIAPMPLYRRAGQPLYYRAYVKAAPGTDLVALKAKLTEQVKPYLVVAVQDGKEFTNHRSAQITMILNVLYALLALSVIIAVLGIINTLALSVVERTREIGVLRAVGLTGGQLARTVTIEAVAIAMFGAVLGTALGLGLGTALQHGLAAQGLDTLSIPWPRLAVALLGAALAGAVAAILPTIRAVRLDARRAIATE